MFPILRIITLFLCLGQIWNSDVNLSKTYIGCFSGTPLGRTSDHSLFPFSPLSCFNLCSSGGLPFVEIVSNTSICYCGYRISPNPNKEKDSQCTPCLQDPTISCGGKDTSSLYYLTSPKLSDEVDVDILFARDVTVAMLHPSTSREDDLATAPESHLEVGSVDFHYAKRKIFALWERQIHRFPFDSNGSAIEVVNITDTCLVAFTIDWVHDHLIWPNCKAIMISDLDGNNSNVLVTSPVPFYGGVDHIVVDPYRGMLFWNHNNEINSCELDGRDMKVVVGRSPSKSINDLALDMVERLVYFSGEVGDSEGIFRVQYDGSGYRKVFSQPPNQPIWGFGVFRSRLYFFSELPDSQATLLRASLTDNVTQPTSLQAIKKSTSMAEMSAHHMKIVHYEMQSPVRVDDCIRSGCSHHCVVRDSTARCLCPRRFDMDTDGKICKKRPEGGGKIVYKVLAGLGCIVLVLLSAGILMCMVDKFWSRIHPTVVRVTTQIPLNRSPIFRQSQSLESDGSSY